MALKFGDSAGGAQKTKVDRTEFKFGENRARMVGNLLARYVYWIPGTNGKNIPFECLEFNRENEKFDSSEKDWVKEYYPDAKCQYGYAIQSIQDGQIRLWDLKKTMTADILRLAKDPELGDPTDPETGWDVVFNKEKTGPNPINVKYSLAERKLKQRPLTAEERELVANAKTVEELMPRPTPEQQKELLEKIRNGSTDEMAEEEVAAEFDVK